MKMNIYLGKKKPKYKYKQKLFGLSFENNNMNTRKVHTVNLKKNPLTCIKDLAKLFYMLHSFVTVFKEMHLKNTI